MPNHVSNRIELKSFDDDWKKEEAAFEQLQSMMKTEQHPFDFNVLIPYPEPFKSLDDARHEAEERGVKWQELPPDGYNQGGYDWCIKHWGTKWNAYDVGFDYAAAYFCTAWNTPRPIFVELSKRFPELRLEVEYADEDRGNNCGRLVYVNGVEKERVDMSDRPDSELFARAVIAEQHAADTWRELQELKAQAKAATTPPPSAADALAGRREG